MKATIWAGIMRYDHKNTHDEELLGPILGLGFRLEMLTSDLSKMPYHKRKKDFSL